MQTHHKALQAAFQQSLLPPKKSNRKCTSKCNLYSKEERNTTQQKKQKKKSSKKQTYKKATNKDTISPRLVKSINTVIILTTKATTPTANTEHVCEITEHQAEDEVN